MPLDNTFKAEKRETVNYEPLPKGIYQLELIDIEEVEKLKYQSESEYEKVLQFTFGVVNEGEFRARRHWENFVPTTLYISSKNGKNKLYQIVEALQKDDIGQKQEAEGLDGKFLNTLIGGQVQVATGIKVKGEKSYQIVESWLPAQTSMKALEEDEKKIEKKEQLEKDPVKVPVDDEEPPMLNTDDLPF